MGSNRRYLVFGPAYLDFVLEIEGALISAEPAAPLLDQSVPAEEMVPRDDGTIVVLGPHGDHLTFPLPAAHRHLAATYELSEPVLARTCGMAPAPPVVGTYPVARVVAQLGGMGAGYAKAFDGTLRAPFGGDAVGQTVQRFLADEAITVVPALLPACPSDTSLVLLAPRGEKLAIGVRQAMVRWQASDADRALVSEADVLVFCGAPNALVAEVLSWGTNLPVMCAPALRNVCDTTLPLAAVAGGIHYLTLNALEWANLPDRDAVRRQVPVISLTDGPRGSRMLYRDGEVAIPAQPFSGPANTNRAGETYGATLLKVLMREHPDFMRTGIDAGIAARVGHIATRQATRQLALTGFAFPPDDWHEEGGR